MDCSNRFTFREFIVSYCTFELAWEVIKKTEDDDRTELCHRWFKNQESAEKWCTDKISGK